MWKQIYNNYEVSDKGEVRNTRTGKLLKPYLNVNGRLRVTVNRKANLVHRLVAQSFIPNPENKPQINHKDGCPTNNNKDNLEWVNNSENMLHAYKIGLRVVYKINQYTKDDVFIRQFKNANEAEYITGISKANIRKVCNGVKHFNTAGGYKWKYVKE